MSKHLIPLSIFSFLLQNTYKYVLTFFKSRTGNLQTIASNALTKIYCIRSRKEKQKRNIVEYSCNTSSKKKENIHASHDN